VILARSNTTSTFFFCLHDNDDDDNNNNSNTMLTITIPMFINTYGTGLPHTQGYYDDDDRSTDEGMHRIKPGH